jgi:hypothetical protein
VVSAIDLAGWAKMHDVAGPAFVISCETLLHRVLRLCEVAQHVRSRLTWGRSRCAARLIVALGAGVALAERKIHHEDFAAQ